MSYGGWRPYVPVAKRRANAARQVAKLRKQGMRIEPVTIQGSRIAHTFWGKAWCGHLEQLGDYANRLPRGRTYVRNGSVCHLEIKPGKVEAIVSGSELYHVAIDIAPLPAARWKAVRKQCVGQIGSMLELLQGRLSNQVMGIVTDPAAGLFPQPRDIKLHCDCPDWAVMCKHVAAVLYGVGARLDERPEQLFVLRRVDHVELISADLDVPTATTGRGKRRRLATPDLSQVFGIDIEDTPPPSDGKAPPRKGARAGSRGASRAKTTTAPGKFTVGKVKTAAKAFTATGAAVGRLRKRYAMTRRQFAALLDVSPQTIANWENRRGRLKLQERTLDALRQAWEKSP